MGYLKGQHEAAATLGLALVVIFILLLGFISLKILTLAFLIVLAYNFFISNGGKGSHTNKIVSAGILAFVVILIISEFVPEIVDVLATSHVELCRIHYIFPLHFLIKEEVIENCAINAAKTQKTAVFCNSDLITWRYKHECIRESVKAGARDCSEVVGYSHYCEEKVAEEIYNQID